ncbi:MAG: hypothetical protein R2758_17325 [Bacteroidales bacterium]
MGASGGTFWYIPTSIKNISTIDSWCEVGYNITSEMKAFAGFQCTANLKVKGYNALDVYVNGGMEGTVATDGMNPQCRCRTAAQGWWKDCFKEIYTALTITIL